MDVLACHQFGEANVVASMGTALTEQQLQQLRRYTNTIVLALDADSAGQAATLRGIDQARESLDREWKPILDPRGMLRFEARLSADLRIMRLPEGQDPDDVIRSSTSLWRELVEQAQPVVDFYFDLVRQGEDLSTAQGKAAAVEQLVPLILEVSNEVQRAHYAQQLARLVQTDERTIERQILRYRSRSARRTQSPPSSDRGAPAQEIVQPEASRPRSLMDNSAAIHCLASLVAYPRLVPSVQAELVELGVGPLGEDDFSRAEERAICRALLLGDLEHSEELDRRGDDLAFHIRELQMYAQELPDLTQAQLLKDLVDSVLRLRIATLKVRSRTLPALAREAEELGMAEDALSYRQMLADIGLRLINLQKTLNSRSHAGRRQMAPVITA